MSFKYIFQGQSQTNTDREFMLNLGMNTEQIEAVLQQKEFETAVALVGPKYSTMTDAELNKACRDAIDEAAGAARIAYVSKGLLIEEEYRLAKSQADEWIAAGQPNEVPSAIQSWAQAAEMIPEEAANDILATATQWEGILTAIRDARLNGKAALNAADTRQKMIEATATQVAAIKSLLPA